MLFGNRQDAGKKLALTLKAYQSKADTVVLALPRGGVPVAFEVANILHLPFDIFLVRKLGVPGQEELAMGAVAERDICVFNDEVLAGIGLDKETIQTIVEREKQEIKRRNTDYRRGKTPIALKDKHIILIDDGIATGATIRAGITAIKTLKPKKITVAVPVASEESLSIIKQMVNEVICLETPLSFFGVGQWYREFPQTTDEEVCQLLDQNKP